MHQKAAYTRLGLTRPHCCLVLQKQGYVSRAAFKLLEIQKKHKVIKPGAARRSHQLVACWS